MRSKALKIKLQKNVLFGINNDALDKNRLEQEMIYYLERLDIAEEQIQLRQYLSYLEEIMKSAQARSQNLGFVVQEIGREMNTMGSKANNVAIQKEVVMMKDSLEKMRKQLNNIF